MTEISDRSGRSVFNGSFVSAIGNKALSLVSRLKLSLSRH
jgi:hypothetical protein